MKSLVRALTLLGFFMTNAAQADGGAELIVLAAPQTGDPYYEEVADQIFDFHITYAQLILDAGDDVLILTDKTTYPHYAEALGKAHVAIAPMEDIWARDYGLSNAAAPVRFRYTAAAQAGGDAPQEDADAVQAALQDLAKEAGLSFQISNLLNDGGNWVDDYAGNIVVSRKFLSDNDLDEDAALHRLQALTGAKHIAFIDADEQGGLEHADGVVSFVDENVLIINGYPEDPDYAESLRTDLETGLPGVTIHEIVTPYDGSNIYDGNFGSACGLYTNALVTPSRIYLPQFGIPEDAEALTLVQAASSKQIVAVPSSGVCSMGGGVRCMSWQLRGDNSVAFLEHFRQN